MRVELHSHLTANSAEQLIMAEGDTTALLLDEENHSHDSNNENINDNNNNNPHISTSAGDGSSGDGGDEVRVRIETEEEGERTRHSAGWLSATPGSTFSTTTAIATTPSSASSTLSPTTTATTPPSASASAASSNTRTTQSFENCKKRVVVPLSDKDVDRLPTQEAKDAIVLLKKVLEEGVSFKDMVLRE